MIKKKKIIDIFDLFKFPLGSLSTNIQLDQNKIEYLDNSEDEIYNSTIDMLDFFEKKSRSHELLSLNKKLKTRLDEKNLKI